jgi:hypothetical protein
MARRKEFEGRMLAILDPALYRGEPSRKRAALLSLGLAGFVFAVSAAAPAPRETAPETSAEARTLATDLPANLAGSTQAAPPVTLDQAKRQPLGGATVTRERTVQREQTRQSTRQETVEAGRSALSADVMQQLIERLGEDTSAEVRRAAAWGLQRYADKDAAQTALARALSGDSNAEVRKMAAWALANSRAETALAALRTAFTADSDDEVREMAVWGLGTRRDGASVTAIGRALGSDRSDEVRATAAWALGQLHPDRAPAALVSLLDSSNEDTRLMAAWALSEIGDSTALPAIEAALAKAPGDATMTRALLRAMVRSGSSEASLSKFLSSADPEIRLYAIKSLAGGGSGASDPWPWPRPRPMPSF